MHKRKCRSGILRCDRLHRLAKAAIPQRHYGCEPDLWVGIFHQLRAYLDTARSVLATERRQIDRGFAAAWIAAASWLEQPWTI
jgi:hypothetical protein